MSTTYIQRQATRTTRNLLAVNGLILFVLMLFVALMALGAAALQKSQNDANARIDAINGSDVLGVSDAVDLSHPTPLNSAEISEARLGELEGKTVTLSAPQAVNIMVPVARWQERATGKRQPKQPPYYFVFQTPATNIPGGAAPGGPPPGMVIPGMVNPMGGPALIIIPSDYLSPGQRTTPSFTGVIRPLQTTDRSVVEGMLQGHGIQTPALPYVLDCLNVGVMKAPPTRINPVPVGGIWGGSGTFLLLFAALSGLSVWNIYKGVRRLKNPSLHPAYAQLARYGNAPDIERYIEADYQRGVQRLTPVEITTSWLLVPSLWSVDAVPLNYIVWIYRPKKVRFGRNMLLRSIIASHTLIMLDRLGKQHVIRSADGQLNQIMATVTQGRPWMETGEQSPLRRQFGTDKAGFIAAVEARRQQMTAQPPQPTPSPTQPTWVTSPNP